MLQNVRRSLALLCIAVESTRLPCSALGFIATPLASPPSKSKARLFMMDLAAAQPPELLLVAHFDANDESSRDRLRDLPASLSARHGDRVTVRLQEEAGAEEGHRCGSSLSSSSPDSGASAGVSSGRYGEGCLPAFQFVRAGLTIDEYHAHDDMPYEEELGKRVDAALSLSRPEDSSTLKELWSPDAAGGDYRDEMAVATYAVHVASKVARELQEELCKQDAISKSDSSPVTVADFSVQAIVLGVLSRYFPGHGFIAEETSPVLRQDPAALSSVLAVVSRVLGLDLTEAELCAAIDLGTRGHGKHERGHWGRGGRTWVLDPIDGTKGFLRGEQFCVALGLLDGGKAVAGILGCPNLPADDEHPAKGSSGGAEGERGLLYTAALGEGSFVRPLSAGADDTRRIMVDHARRPSETRVLESVEATHTSHAVTAQVCSDLSISLSPIRVDGQCKYGLLSEGQGGIYLRLPRWGYVENIWDHVAGAVVIREAGGKVTDSRGEPLDFSLGAKLPREVVGVVATSGKIHAEVLRAVHNRQLEDWARVVAEAKSGDWETGDAAPQLPGVDWAYWNNGREGVGEEWWARAAEQRQPLVMRTSEQFYGTLERGWDKLVAVLFHGSWTQESQHAVSILENLAGRQQAPPPLQAQQQSQQQQQQQQYEQVRPQKQYSSSQLSDFEWQQSQPPPPPPPPPSSSSSSSSLERGATATAEAPKKAETKTTEAQTTCLGTAGDAAAAAAAPDTIPILLAEADVMSLIDVADRQAIAGLPSLHLHLGGREIVRFPVDSGESADSLGARIDEVASRVCAAGRRYQR